MFENDMKKNLDIPFYDVYEIQKGDNLYQISKKYNVNTKLLAELNGLDLDDYIYPGQIIYIPKKNVVLLDDIYENVFDWELNGGRSIIFDPKNKVENKKLVKKLDSLLLK